MHILIKVIVLSLEIMDCTFKLSITGRLSGLNGPSDSNQALQFTAHSSPTSFHLGPGPSGRQRGAFLLYTIREDKCSIWPNPRLENKKKSNIRYFKSKHSLKGLDQHLSSLLVIILLHTKTYWHQLGPIKGTNAVRG